MDVLDLRQPIVRILFRGVDITDATSSEWISTTVTDNLEGHADEVQIEFRNNHGRWFDAWFPELNDKMQVFLGYKGGRLLDAGTFFLDQPNAQGARSGDTFSLRGQSKPVNQALKTKKTRGFEKQSQKQIAQKVLSDAGLGMIGNPPDVLFERNTQRREFDLEYLARLASDFGCFFAVKGGNAIYANRDDLFAQQPVTTLTKGDRAIIRYHLKHDAEGTYSKAKASYFDGNTKKNIEVEVEDGQVKTGDTKRTDDRVESKAQADKMVRSKLQKANMKAWTGDFELVGDPTLQAGVTLGLAGYGRWNRKYIIQRARHQWTRRSATTNIEIADARASQSGGK
ncbi:MAG: contractile injection system protein, VgrG/Pvc8 family [Rhodoblastus sp.]